MGSTAFESHPLLLKPTLKQKIWGGEALQRLFGYSAPPDEPVGEAWLAEGDSVVLNGAQSGRTIADLTASHPDEILGKARPPGEEPIFPLLAKFLDAESVLSVQVHPPDAYAREREHVPYGKAEAWYVIEARPGACVYHGTARDISREDLMTALTAGRADEVLAKVPVHAGDVIVNPPGTIHALGGGLVVYEIQQWSDITYRLYDWDRRSTGQGKRELHLRQGMDVARLQPLPRHAIRPVRLKEDGFARTLLCVSRYFCAELLEVRPGSPAGVAVDSCHILTQVEGTTTVSTGGNGANAVALRSGMTVLIPAAAGRYRVEARERSRTLCAYVPDIRRDVVERLRSRGVPDVEIVQLDGDPAGGDVDAALSG